MLTLRYYGSERTLAGKGGKGGEIVGFGGRNKDFKRERQGDIKHV